MLPARTWALVAVAAAAGCVGGVGSGVGGGDEPDGPVVGGDPGGGAGGGAPDGGDPGGSADGGATPGVPGAPGATDDRPNFLVIIADDQRVSAGDATTTFGAKFMPQTFAEVFDAGVQFSRAYATTSVCNPSRSSIYTGRYARHHRVLSNSDVFDQASNPTIARKLKAAGYLTGMVGKFLNSNPADNPFPEFDLWAEHLKGEGSYFDNTLFDTFSQPAGLRPTTGYSTDVLRDYVIGDGMFLDRAAASGKPFLLFFNPRAPHEPAEPDVGDALRYAGLPRFRPASYNEANVADKPSFIQSQPLLTTAQQSALDDFRLDQLRTLASLDRAIAAMLDKLRANGQLDNTVVVYLSDNGMFWGEHRFDQGKARLYEEAARVPMAIWGGARTALAGIRRVEERLVANIDVAPTLLELAGLPPAAGMDGLSLVPLLRGLGAARWRDDLLLEIWHGTPAAGLRTGVQDEAYYENEGDATEYYDFGGNHCPTDPDQLQNRFGGACAAGRPNSLATRLHDYCDLVPGASFTCP